MCGCVGVLVCVCFTRARVHAHTHPHIARIRMRVHYMATHTRAHAHARRMRACVRRRVRGLSVSHTISLPQSRIQRLQSPWSRCGATNTRTRAACMHAPSHLHSHSHAHVRAHTHTGATPALSLARRITAPSHWSVAVSRSQSTPVCTSIHPLTSMHARTHARTHAHTLLVCSPPAQLCECV